MVILGAHQHRTDIQNVSVICTNNGDLFINKRAKSCHFPGKWVWMEIIIVSELSQFAKDKCAFSSFVVIDFIYVNKMMCVYMT